MGISSSHGLIAGSGLITGRTCRPYEILYAGTHSNNEQSWSVAETQSHKGGQQVPRERGSGTLPTREAQDKNQYSSPLAVSISLSQTYSQLQTFLRNKDEGLIFLKRSVMPLHYAGMIYNIWFQVLLSNTNNFQIYLFNPKMGS